MQEMRRMGIMRRNHMKCDLSTLTCLEVLWGIYLPIHFIMRVCRR